MSSAGAELWHELRRWGLCGTFVHQHWLIAQPTKPAVALAKRTKSARRGAWRPYRVKQKRALGLAAAKHAQQIAGPLPNQQDVLPAVAVDYGWPEDMRLQLFACRTPEDRQAWAERWAEHLSGRAAQRKIAEATPQRPAAAGWPVLDRRLDVQRFSI